MLYSANSDYLTSPQQCPRSCTSVHSNVHLYRGTSLMSSRPVALPAAQAPLTETESNGLLKPGSQAGSAAAHQIINQ